MAARQAWPRATRWAGSSPSIPLGRVAATAWARARSMLSPPSRMCSPTARRVRARSPPWSVTAIRVKSVVPPPTSQTRRRSPTLTRFRQLVALRGEPGVEGGLGLLQEGDVLQPGGPGGLDGQLAGRRRRTRRGRSGGRPGVRAGRRRSCRRSRGSRRRGGGPGRRSRPRRARPWPRRRPRSRGGSGSCGRPRRARASSWPSRPAGPAPWPRGRGRTSRRPGRPASTRAGRAPRRGTPWRRAGRGTTAGPAGRRRR